MVDSPVVSVMKRRFWKSLLLFVGLPVLLLTGLQFWAASRITPDSIAKLLTESHNCRATVGSASVRLFSFPARVEVKDIKITPFDETQKPTIPGETWIRTDQALLEVNVWSLLTGELDV